MTIPHSKYIIIGAGLSGLTIARELKKQKEDDFIILEGRDFIGGRIHTNDGIDLGATWFHDHHTYLSQLMDDLGLKRFSQYSKGKSVLVYNSMAPAHYFESDPNSPSASRIADGSIHLINTLAAPVLENIRLNTTVETLIENKDSVTIKTNNGIYATEKVVFALPPQIASQLNFEPPLLGSLINAMKNTHTWMSNAIKVGLTFERPFWREAGYSGTIIGQVGPTIELYDHSDYKESTFALMGFVNEGLRDESPEDRKERILVYLETHLGKEIRNYLSYQEKDWSVDNFTSCERLKSVYISPRYGNSLFQEAYMNNKLFFAGAETSPVHGGYMDGAVYSALLMAERVIKT